jgi:hypothetical protein
MRIYPENQFPIVFHEPVIDFAEMLSMFPPTVAFKSAQFPVRWKIDLEPPNDDFPFFETV